MKQIILSAIAAVVITVGVYDVALLCGVSPDRAFAVAAITGSAAASTISFAVASVTVAAAAAAAFVASAAALIAAVFAVTSAIVVAAAAAAAFVVTYIALATILALGRVGVEDKAGLNMRRVFATYLLEAGTIVGALSVGLAWSAPVALIGIVALATLGYASRNAAKLAES